MSLETRRRKLTSSDELELRSVVKFCVGLKLSPSETLKKIEESDTLPVCGKTFVYKWHGRFKSGRTSVNDDDRPGRPTSSVTSRNTSRVEELVRSRRRVTVREIAEELSLTSYAVFRILTEELNMSKVSARWVPRLLRDTDKQRRVECSQAFLQRFDSDGEDFLNRIVTTDETWLHYYDPESKQQSSVWKTPNTPPPKKARAQRSCQKEMFIFFMDRQGVILQHRVRDGCTVNAEYYSKVSKNKLSLTTLLFGSVYMYKLFLQVLASLHITHTYTAFYRDFRFSDMTWSKRYTGNVPTCV